MMRWHHLSGLLFAVVTITWIFSGLMSMNPWKLFASSAALAQATYEGPPGPRHAGLARALIAALPAAPGTELDARRRAEPGPGAHGGRRAAAAVGAASASRRARPPRCARAATLLPDARLAEVQTLERYDFYYARDEHAMLGHVEKPLPAWRLVYDNPRPPGSTWIRPPASSSAGRTAPTAPAAGCSPSCTAGTGPACWRAALVGRAADLPEPGRGRAQPDRRGDRLAPAGEEIAALKAAGRARPGNAARDALCSQPRPR